MRFSGYVWAVAARLQQNFQPYIMTFDGDIHQTKIKNSSLGNPKFSADLHSMHVIFLFERVCQDAGHYRVSFLNEALFLLCIQTLI